MAVRVTIETRDKEAADVVAHHLGAGIRPKSWRGLGVLRVVARDAAETADLVDRVSRLVENQRDLGWIRIRYEDESRVFRSNGRRPS